MDVQRKKGILEVCVLAVLKKGPSYGYMIIRELEQCVEISESTLYPILKRLEQNGSLETYRKEYNGRMRKYYQLTDEGQSKIDQFLEEWDELQNMYRFVEIQNMQQPSGEVAEECAETAEVTETAETAGDTKTVEETKAMGITDAAEATETVEITAANELENMDAADVSDNTSTAELGKKIESANNVEAEEAEVSRNARTAEPENMNAEIEEEEIEVLEGEVL